MSMAHCVWSFLAISATQLRNLCQSGKTMQGANKVWMRSPERAALIATSCRNWRRHVTSEQQVSTAMSSVCCGEDVFYVGWPHVAYTVHAFSNWWIVSMCDNFTLSWTMNFTWETHKSAVECLFAAMCATVKLWNIHTSANDVQMWFQLGFKVFFGSKHHVYWLWGMLNIVLGCGIVCRLVLLLIIQWSMHYKCFFVFVCI